MNEHYQYIGMHKGAQSELYRFAEELRQRMTEAEKKLWLYLRKKLLGYKFRRQHPFSLYILDFYCHKAKLVDNLTADEKKFNELTDYLFKLLEKRSLFKASEHLALKVLTQSSCTVNDDLAKQLESYRAMKIGNTAPDIVFSGDVLKSGTTIETPSRLSDIQSAYKVVIFGASWCPKCGEEVSQLLPLYEKWKSKGVEVVFVSLDTDKALFKAFAGIFPFISVCDYQQWENQAVQDYYVFATPTMFLLDNDHTIILRPTSVKQMDAWVDWYSSGEKEDSK